MVATPAREIPALIYFWSDTHFNHAGIINYCARPYKDVKEMNAGLIDRWNQVVRPQDDIYLLGDFGFDYRPPVHVQFEFSRGEPLLDIFNKLNGRKRLLRGNHDMKNSEVLALPWQSIQDIAIVRHNKVKAVCCHYPMESWPDAHRGSLMLHGHSHGSLKRKIPHRFDVGCDIYTTPISFDNFIAVANQQAFEPSDHHGSDM